MEYRSRRSLLKCSDDEFNSYVQAVIRNHNYWMLATGLLAIVAWATSVPLAALIDTALFCALFFSTRNFACHVVPQITRDREAIHEYIGQFKGKDS